MAKVPPATKAWPACARKVMAFTPRAVTGLLPADTAVVPSALAAITVKL